MSSEKIGSIVQAPNFFSEVSVEGYQIPPNNIMYCSVKENIFDVVCKLELHILDSGVFTELTPLHDGKIFSVKISKNKKEEYINYEFKTENFTIERTDIGNGMYSLIKIVGVQKDKNLFYPMRTKSHGKKTTAAILEEVLTPSYKVENRIKSRDVQTWLQINQSDFDFIKHLKEKSYVQDNDLMFCYTKRDGKSVITSLKNELSRQKDSKFLVIYDPKKYEDRGLGDIVTQEVEKDKASVKKNVIYFKSFSFTDNTATVSKRDTYGLEWTYFDVDNSSFNKGSVSDSLNPLTTHGRRSKDGAGQTVDSVNFVYQTTNVHEKYIDSKMSNMYYNNLFFSSSLTLMVGGNEKVELFDKVEVKFPSQLDASISKNVSIDHVNSGEYIIGSIQSKVSKGGRFIQVLTLFRAGFNKGAFEKDFPVGV